jgi:ElaB/YqjD/DUF883 family membrane-anchored ribosome-binding protein
MEQTQVGKVPSNVQEVPGRGETFQAAREAAHYADRTVHENPWTSIGVGFGLGVVVGALIAIVARSRSSTFS